MTKKIVSSVMCGIYISLGATAYIALLQEDSVAAALFFASGILLVSTFYNMLATRVFALYAFKTEHGYRVSDIFIALLGNCIGCLIYAGLLSLTRYDTPERTEQLKTIVNARLNDSYVGIFIFAILCGFLVACACLASKAIPDNRGVSMSLSVVFIAVFVICVPEHVVADMFFFAYYSFVFGFDAEFIPILLITAAGNAVGGIGTGYLEQYRRYKQKSAGS